MCCCLKGCETAGMLGMGGNGGLGLLGQDIEFDEKPNTIHKA